MASCKKDVAIFYGDSITSSNPGMVKWVNIVQDNLGLTAINYGINGSTLIQRPGYNIPSFEEVLEKNFHVYDTLYKYLFIAYGTNDIGMNDSLHTSDRYYTVYDSLIKKIIAAGWPPKKIVIISPSYTTYEGREQYKVYGIAHTAPQERVIQFVDITRKVAEQNNCTFVNTYPALNNNASYLTDGIHPTEYGHTLLANAILNQLK